MSSLFHVTSVLNRASIAEHGLDWSRMGAARGIAGSTSPEVAGVFLVTEAEIDWFVRMNNTGGPVDVWAVDGIEQRELVMSPEGYRYLPRRIPANQLLLVRREIAAEPLPTSGDSDSTAYRSSLTIRLHDGTVVHDEQAHAWLRRAAAARGDDPAGGQEEPDQPKD